MRIRSISLHPRSVLALLIGMTLVIVPAGIIYSASFLTLGALFPAAGFRQSSHGLGAVTWRILCCLACAAAGGYFTQAFSRERRSFTLGILSGVCVVLGLMGIPTSNLLAGHGPFARIALSFILGVVIYASGRMANRASRVTA
jgi:hypothetical protein